MDNLKDVFIVTGIIAYYATKIPDKVALKFEGLDLTYQDFELKSNQIANGLLDLGTRPDERVGYLGKNSHRFYQILFGTGKAGGVICPINWRLAVPEIAYILNDAAIQILFLGPEYVNLIEDIKKHVPALKQIILVEPAPQHEKDFDVPIFTDWRDAFPKSSPEIIRTPEDAFAQLYTSGTTGNPKGAVLSNKALMTTLKRNEDREAPEWNTWTHQDVSLIAMPCFHIGGTAWGLTTLGNGATGVIMREFYPTQILQFIDDFKISKIFLVPAAMQFVVNQPNAREVDYSRLKYILYGASPIPLDLLKQCMDVFSCGFVQMYGMTETSGTIVALPPEDHDLNGNPRMRSAGKAMDGVELAIMDKDCNFLPADHIGEIVTRSTMNMLGYWNLPEATEKTLTDEGWLRTGDAGYLDEDGYLYIHDRVKDMIISGGENIYPAEVENALYGHKDINDVAVIGAPDEKWGEAVVAIVVKKPNSELSVEEVIEYSKSKIARYKCPKRVDFIKELPRNASGKILKKDLRKAYWSDQEKAVN